MWGTMSSLGLGFPVESLAVYVCILYVYLSYGLLNNIMRGIFKLYVSAYCLKSSPMINGDSPSTKSNENVTGRPCASMMFNSHMHLIGYAPVQSTPHPCMYRDRSFVTVKVIGNMSQMMAAFTIPPVDFGVPSSNMGLGSACFTDPVDEKATIFAFARFHQDRLTCL